MNQKSKIIDVINHDLCIACGSCIEACPNNNIEPSYSSYRGCYEVKLLEKNNCANCNMECEKSCPSIELDFNELGKEQDEKVERDNWIKSLYLAYSIKESTNGISSSGGIIRKIIKEQLKSGASIVCLLKTKTGTEVDLLNNINDLDKVPGSIYHSVDFSKAISKIRSSSAPVTLIAIPCQLEGIMKYITNFEPKLEKKIGLSVGIICGWMYSDHALRSFNKKHNIKSKYLHATEYRGEDRVGNIKIKTLTNDTVAFSRSEFSTLTDFHRYKSSFSTDSNRMRCRACENHINLLADIIAGDAWLSRKGKSKMSIIGCRTDIGESFFNQLKLQDDIKFEKSSFNDLIESQSYNLIYGEKATAIKSSLPDYLMINSFDKNEKRNTTLLQALNIRFELFRRLLIRKEMYNLHGALYVFIKIRTYVIRQIIIFIKRYRKWQDT